MTCLNLVDASFMKSTVNPRILMMSTDSHEIHRFQLRKIELESTDFIKIQRFQSSFKLGTGKHRITNDHFPRKITPSICSLGGG